MDTVANVKTSSSVAAGSSDEDEPMQPSGQRWDPLGAAKNDDDDEHDEDGTALAQYDTDSNRTHHHHHHHHQLQHHPDPGRIKSLEDEQEMLSTSLFALTSHFAQVQFRLRQIVDSPAEQRDQLLHSLEEFAFRGIPDEVVAAGPAQDTVANALSPTAASGDGDTGSHEPLFEAMELQRNRQIELIEQLKRQLTDVERFAYESGSKILPQSMLVEKQRVIIDELRDKLNLNVCDADLPQLSSEQLRSQVDSALVELVGPVKMKDTLVGQLKTQIVDLERFVAHLQCETYDLKQMTKSMGGFKGAEAAYSTYNSKMAKTRRQSRMGSTTSTTSSMAADGAEPTVAAGAEDLPAARAEPSAPIRSNGAAEDGHRSARQSVQESLTDKAAGVLEKASNLLSMFAVTQLGCGAHQQQQPPHFQKNTLKRTAKGNHWGDLRAQLEIDVQEICSLVASVAAAKSRLAARAQRQRPRPAQHESSDEEAEEEEEEDARGDDDDDSSTPSETPIAQRYSPESLASIQLEITTMVRKHFAITLQRLIEHGLRENGGVAGQSGASNTSLVPFMGCFARRTRAATMQRRRSYAGGGDEYGETAGGGWGAEEHEAYDQRRQMHAWELCLEYYHIKNGEEFNETPARMLSQSFNLDITDGSSTITSAKQSLLGAIGTIIRMHLPYKRSANSHFKALVSMGLNSQKLPQWLNLMFQCRELVQQHYADWSYVRHTGFRDGLKCLDRLSCYHFDLPVDLAIRQFQNIKDVF